MDPVPFTEDDRSLLVRLGVAVFGLEGDPASGLLHEMRELNSRMGRLYFAILTAAISFGFGSIAVCVALITTG